MRNASAALKPVGLAVALILVVVISSGGQAQTSNATTPVAHLAELVSASERPPADGFNKHGLLALAFSGTCTVSLAWQQPVGRDSISDNPAISPVVANGVVYYADGTASQVFAVDARNGQILWSTDNLPAAERIAGGIFTSPTVVNGQLFVAGFDHKLHAFGL